MSGNWWVVGSSVYLNEGDRIHCCVEGRFITIFRNKGRISSIDSVCHHAGGPLTLGKLTDIEDLGITVVSCPWHRFLVSIDGGIKAYQAIEIINGKPTPVGWRTGKEVQRAHTVEEREGKILLRLRVPTAEEGEDWSCVSDKDACNVRCGQEFQLHFEEPYPYES